MEENKEEENEHVDQNKRPEDDLANKIIWKDRPLSNKNLNTIYQEKLRRIFINSQSLKAPEERKRKTLGNINYEPRALVTKETKSFEEIENPGENFPQFTPIVNRCNSYKASKSTIIEQKIPQRKDNYLEKQKEKEHIVFHDISTERAPIRSKKTKESGNNLFSLGDTAIDLGDNSEYCGDCDLCPNSINYPIVIKVCPTCLNYINSTTSHSKLNQLKALNSHSNKKTTYLFIAAGIYVLISLILIITLSILYSKADNNYKEMKDKYTKLDEEYIDLTNRHKSLIDHLHRLNTLIMEYDIRYTHKMSLDLEYKAYQKRAIRENKGVLNQVEELRRFIRGKKYLEHGNLYMEGIIRVDYLSKQLSNIKTSESIIQASTLHSRIETESYYQRLESLKQQSRAFESFIVMTSGEDIWEWSAGDMITPITTQIISTNDRYTKGALLRENILVMGGSIDNGNGIKIYKIEAKTHSLTLISTYKTSGYVKSCFPHIYKKSAICLEYSGIAMKYSEVAEIEELYIDTKVGENFVSGICTMDNIIIIGGNLGWLHMLGESGEILNIYQYPSRYSVNQIAEIRRGILLTTDGNNGCFLHNIRNPYAPISTNLFKELDEHYLSISVLQRGEGHFALGGGGRDDYGFLDIYHLKGNNLEVDLVRKKEEIQGKGCWINVIREITIGVLVFGGGYNCEVICMWKYADYWPLALPICWGVHTSDGITDILPMPIFY